MLRFSFSCIVCCLISSCAAWPTREPRGPILPDRPAKAPTPHDDRPLASVPVTPPAQTPTVTAPAMTPVSTTKTVAKPEWQTWFKTEQGHVAETLRVGDGPRRILISSSLHGSDADSVHQVEAVAATLQAHPELADGLTVLCIRTPNPDGFADRTLTNAQGVDLNRNFPSPRFPTNTTSLTGSKPASEQETQAFLKLLQDFAPHRLVHLASGTGKRGLVLMNQPTQPHVQDWIGSGRDLDLSIFDDEYKAGSLEEFAALQLKIETLVVELPRQPFVSTKRPEAEPYLSLALSTRGRKLPILTVPETASTPPTLSLESSREVPVAKRPTADVSWGDGKKGYVQFLPPPPGLAQQGDGNPKYFELVPPPGNTAQ